jgi:hypothetical protein
MNNEFNIDTSGMDLIGNGFYSDASSGVVIDTNTGNYYDGSGNLIWGADWGVDTGASGTGNPSAVNTNAGLQNTATPNGTSWVDSLGNNVASLAKSVTSLYATGAQVSAQKSLIDFQKTYAQAQAGIGQAQANAALATAQRNAQYAADPLGFLTGAGLAPKVTPGNVASIGAQQNNTMLWLTVIGVALAMMQFAKGK